MPAYSAPVFLMPKHKRIDTAYFFRHCGNTFCGVKNTLVREELGSNFDRKAERGL